MTKAHLSGLILDPDSFKLLADLAYRESGLQLVEEKKAMIQSRLRHRVAALGTDNFASYADYVCSMEGVHERTHMISALTTNVSHFFRESHHFQGLTEAVIRPRLRDYANGTPLRIWSAGCANGQEPLSIVISILEAFPDSIGFDFKVLATDIDPKVVTFANAGVYPTGLVNGVPDDVLSKYFEPVETAEKPAYKACKTVMSKIVYRTLNLLGDWPMSRKMDAIFCRNVVIYFDRPTQDHLWAKFREQLQPHGCLFLGHSERINAPHECGFAANGPTTYMPQ